MAKDSYVDGVDVVLGVGCLAFAVWALAATDSRSATVGFGIAGLVLGLLSVTVLRGRFALIGLAVWIIGVLYGITTADALPGASYGLLFAAAVFLVPRGFRNAKSQRTAATR